MTISGIYLEYVPEDSDDFAAYKQHMGLNIVKLFKIEYNNVDSRNLMGSEWSAVQFFHGTGHCGCITGHTGHTLRNKMTIASWCETEQCAVGGILRHGHLMRFSVSGGLWFSPSASVALSYAQRRQPTSSHSRAIFICKARHFAGVGHSYVRCEEDIHPVYLAIV